MEIRLKWTLTIMKHLPHFVPIPPLLISKFSSNFDYASGMLPLTFEQFFACREIITKNLFLKQFC